MLFDTVEQDNTAIRQLVEDVQANQLDVEPFLALHTEDAIIVNFGGRRVAGKGTLRQAMTAALSTPLARVTTTAAIDDIRFIRPDVAIVSATKHVTDDRDETDTLAAAGSLTYLVAKEPDTGWRIALAHTTPIAGSTPPPRPDRLEPTLEAAVRRDRMEQHLDATSP